MSEPCPWCSAPLGDETPCPSCMRDPALHPSRAGDTGGLELDLAPEAPTRAPAVDAPVESLELPPLTGLDLAPSSSPSPSAGGRDRAPTSDAESVESLPGLALDLDADPVAPTPAPRPAPPGDDDVDVAGLALEEVAKPTPRIAPTSVREGAAPPRAVDPAVRAAALAGWGPAPDSPVGWPVYAARVLLRRRALRKELERGRVVHRQGVRAVLEQQVALITPLVAARSPAVEPFLPLLEDVDAKAAEKQAEVAAVSEAKGTEMEAVDAQLANAHEERRQRSRDLEVAKAFREQAEERLRTAEDALVAKKRAVDEAHEAAQRAAPGADFAPPAHARAIVAAEEAVASVAAKLPERKAKLDEAKRKEHERRKAMAVTEKTIERLVRERSRVEFDTYAAVGDERHALDEVVDRRLETYGEVLTQILKQAPRAFDPATLERARELRSRRQHLDDEQTALEAAPDAYDPDALQRGVILLGVAVLAIVVAAISLVW